MPTMRRVFVLVGAAFVLRRVPHFPATKSMWADTTYISTAKAQEAQRSFSNQGLKAMSSHGNRFIPKWQNSRVCVAMTAPDLPTAITVPRRVMQN